MLQNAATTHTFGRHHDDEVSAAVEKTRKGRHEDMFQKIPD